MVSTGILKIEIAIRSLVTASKSQKLLKRNDEDYSLMAA